MNPPNKHIQTENYPLMRCVSTFDGSRTSAADYKICSKCKQTKPLTEYYKGQYQCKTCCNKHQKEYRKTEKGKARQRRYHYPYPERIKAKNFVNHAIRDGKLSRPDVKLCWYCTKPAQQYHHYRGYEPEHWLDILPICRKCHTRTHASWRSIKRRE